MPSSRLTSVSRVLVCACHTRRSSKNSLPTVQQILQTHQQMASDWPAPLFTQSHPLLLVFAPTLICKGRCTLKRKKPQLISYPSNHQSKQSKSLFIISTDRSAGFSFACRVIIIICRHHWPLRPVARDKGKRARLSQSGTLVTTHSWNV